MNRYPEGWFEEVEHGVLVAVRHFGCPPTWLYAGAAVFALVFIGLGVTWLNAALCGGGLAGWAFGLRTVTRDDAQLLEIFLLHLTDGQALYEGRDFIR